MATAYTGEPWRALSKISVSNGTGNRVWSIGVQADIDVSGAGSDGDQASWEHSPGASLTLYVEEGTAGTTPPGECTSFEAYFVQPGSTLQVGSTKWTGSGLMDETPHTAYMASNPLGGAPLISAYRAGMIELYVRVKRTDAGVTVYDVDSKGSDFSVPTGGSTRYARGYFRAPFTLESADWDDSNLFDGPPVLFAVEDSWYWKAVVAAQTFNTNDDLTFQWKYDTKWVNSTDGAATGREWSGENASPGTRIDNSFHNFRASYDAKLIHQTSIFGGDDRNVWAATGHPAPWAINATDAKILENLAVQEIDPRITIDHHMQVNDNAFATPPGSKDKTPKNRLTSDLAFLGARFSNANGKGLNGITYSEEVADVGGLVASVARSANDTTVTQGGEDGWSSTFLAWDKALPGGGWNHTVDVASPTYLTGLEVNPTEQFSLLAINPAYTLILGLGVGDNAKTEDHLTPGVTMIVGLAVYNSNSKQLLTLDTDPSPTVVIGRFNLTTGRGQYLDSDMTWKDLVDPATAYAWPMGQSAGDPKVWVRTFDTTGFTSYSIFGIGKANVKGTPYQTFSSVEVLGGKVKHSEIPPKEFDPIAFALHGVIGNR